MFRPVHKISGSSRHSKSYSKKTNFQGDKAIILQSASISFCKIQKNKPSSPFLKVVAITEKTTEIFFR
jgi:hypothetical protein